MSPRLLSGILLAIVSFVPFVVSRTLGHSEDFGDVNAQNARAIWRLRIPLDLLFMSLFAAGAFFTVASLVGNN